MSGADLTRWNRAGLSRFRYIDGNAAEWLEDVRQALLAEGGGSFSEWEAIQGSALPDESDSERLERLLEQYEQGRREMLWEMTRAFARSCHILTEYTDVYANERYLRTATQWENLRRMVEMLDYHPASPSSASTMLVLEAKKDEKGEVEEGFQVKYSPPDGSAPVIFETLEDIEVSSDLNELRLAGSVTATGELGSNTYIDGNGDQQQTWVATEDMDGLSAGQIVVVKNGSNEAVVDEIASFSEDTGVVSLNGNGWHEYPKADARLLLKANAVRTPRLNGDNVVQFENPHGLSSKDVISWKPNDNWFYAEVLESDGLRIRFAGNTSPSGEIYRAFVIKKPTSGDILFPLDGYLSISKVNTGIASTPAFEAVKENGEDYANRVKSPDAGLTELYLVNGEDNKVGIVTVPESGFTFDGGSGELSSGDWVACETDDDGTRVALKVKRVTEQEDSFMLALSDGLNDYEGKIRRFYGPFKYTLSPQGHDQNESPLSEDGETSSVSLEIDEEQGLPELLVPGRRLVLEQKNGDDFENAVTVVATATETVENEDGLKSFSLSFDPPLDADAGFTKWNTVIRANVVEAGHGEKQPERVLGSGIADQSNQEFVFANKNVSFVADSTMDSGVRAAIDVKVDGRIWEQVATLNDSRSTDAHYSVRMTEEGYIRICFGDGEHGRRLPSGTSNVRIVWRKGTGLTGYVEASGLEKPVKPHRLLEFVRQPIATSGSGDMENESSLRENAPASLLTLERAVSITDFKNLAASYSSVAQANAFTATALKARHDSVEVVVVPADSSDLSDDLKGKLEEYLANRSMPGIEVQVSGFEGVTLALDITVRGKKEEYDPEIVKANAKSALLEAFSLENRRLGQPLYRSELYEIVEAVEGVENSTCEITEVNAPDVIAAPLIIKGDDNVTIKAVKATRRQVIHLAADGLAVTVGYEEFTL